jgi:iron complex transport system ATP-binding protein
MDIEARNISWHVRDTRILDNISLHVGAGELVGIVGPNGSGKTSLLRCLGGVEPVTAGDILIDHRPIDHRRGTERARQVATVSQTSATDIDLTVVEVVALGRIPHRDRWSRLTLSDRELVHAALERVGLTAFAGRRWQTLSGGEKQRVQLARAYAQEPQILLLDEPTNHLDIRSQLQLMSLISHDTDRTTIAVLHDLQLAATYCSRIVVIAHGRIVVDDIPAAALTPDLLASVFGIDARVTQDNDALTLRYVDIV